MVFWFFLKTPGNSGHPVPKNRGFFFLHHLRKYYAKPLVCIKCIFNYFCFCIYNKLLTGVRCLFSLSIAYLLINKYYIQLLKIEIAYKPRL